MNVNVAKSCKSLKTLTDKFIGENKALDLASRGFELSIGPASDPNFQTPAHAQDAIFVGDSARINGSIATAEVDALFKQDQSKVSTRPVYDSETMSWKYLFEKAAMTNDAFSPLAGQMFSPWNVSFFQRIFREPLLYSHARDLVRMEQGTNPWAEVMTLLMEQYAGFAITGATGSAQNTITNDVNVVNGMMTSPVVNMAVTYSLTLEEQNRSKQGNGNPFAGQSMMQKQKYANYVLNMLTDYLIYYGNDETNTPGLFDVNPIVSWAGAPISTIANGSSATKGADAYKAVYRVINDFLTSADNKFDEVIMSMSPEAYNAFTSLPYSENFNPTAAHKILTENYAAGKGQDGKIPSVRFVSDPMLKAGSIFNPTNHDYMVMTAPEVGAGPQNEKQPLVLFGSPLMDFVFPAMPGQYNTQYKTMRRVAGVFAPVPQAIRVYQGFGR